MGDVSLSINGGSSTHTSQIVTIQSDNSSLPTGVTLIETNYALWSQVMEKSIVAHEKLGYLTGDTPKPHELSSTYNKCQLQGIFQEIDHRSPIRMHCAADVTEC
ncbi:unnamed protein product [Prunus brigantina]